MTRVFVCEYLSAGGDVAGDPADHATLLPSGVAMRDAIVADLLQLPDCAVTVARAPVAPGLPDAVASVAARSGESLLAFVAREAPRHDRVWIVAPETGGCLCDFARAVPPSGWIGCSVDAIALTTSKRATLQCLAAAGLPTPLDFELAPTQRWVAKPDDGAGTVATQVSTDRCAAHALAAQRRAAGETVVVEPWVEGDALSASLLCSRGGAELLSVNRQHVEVGACGRVRYDGVSVDVLTRTDARRAAIEAICLGVVAAIPGLRGFVGIDLVWHATRGPVVIELNPRTTCAYVGLSAALGRNLAGAWLAAHAEETVHAVA